MLLHLLRFFVRDGETVADLANCVAGLSCIYFDEERATLNAL
jgi:hypothetical protein